MRPSTSSSYRLKRFFSSRDPDFASALLIYVRFTPPSIRSDSREIAYWIDHVNDTSDDTFYIFGFYRNRQLVGYGQATYFPDEHLYFIDYVTIDEQYRGNVFFEMVEQMRHYLEDAHPEYRYGVTEVMNEPGQNKPSREKRVLARLLKFIGFGVIHAPYFQPRLTPTDCESELSGSLLLYSPTPIKSIRTETYLSILRTIYYELYLPWQTFRTKETSAYKKHLDILYSAVEEEIRKSPTIIVNGYRDFLPPGPRSPVITQHRLVVFSLEALAVIVALTAIMLGLKSYFRLTNTAFAAIYGLALGSFFAVASIVSDKARVMFRELASLAKHFFGKRGVGLLPNDSESEDSSPMHQTDEGS